MLLALLTTGQNITNNYEYYYQCLYQLTPNNQFKHAGFHASSVVTHTGVTPRVTVSCVVDSQGLHHLIQTRGEQLLVGWTNSDARITAGEQGGPIPVPHNVWLGDASGCALECDWCAFIGDVDKLCQMYGHSSQVKESGKWGIQFNFSVFCDYLLQRVLLKHLQIRSSLQHGIHKWWHHQGRCLVSSVSCSGSENQQEQSQ